MSSVWPSPRRWDFRRPVLRAARKRPAQTLRISSTRAAVVRRCSGSCERTGPPSTQRALWLGAAESRAQHRQARPIPSATAASKRRCHGNLSLVAVAALPCSSCGTLPHTRGMAPASLPSGRVLVAIEAIIAIASTAATPDIAPAASRRWCAGVDHRRGNASRGPVRGKCAARVGGLYPISATGRCESPPSLVRAYRSRRLATSN